MHDEVTMAGVVYAMQASFSALGIFIGLWGFVQFAPCLWRVLTQRVLEARYQHCARHSVVAMLCLATMVLAFARMNTIGFLPLGPTAAGLAYIAGIFIMVVVIGLAVWSSARTHAEGATTWKTQPEPIPNLAQIVRMLVLVTFAFLAVGVLRLGS